MIRAVELIGLNQSIGSTLNITENYAKKVFKECFEYEGVLETVITFIQVLPWKKGCFFNYVFAKVLIT